MNREVSKPCNKKLQVIMFDFHGTLSLNVGRTGEYKNENNILVPVDIEYAILYKINTLKNSLRQFKSNRTDSWYNALKKSQIDPRYVVPTIDQLIYFTDHMKQLYPNIVFAIGSNLEHESFIDDVMKYAYQTHGKPSPFEMDYIIGLKKLGQYRNYKKGERKMVHLSILQRIWSEQDKGTLDLKNTVLIDNSDQDIDSVGNSVCTVKVNDFFTIDEWNSSINRCNLNIWKGICELLLY